jgi:hypothetical protein
MKAKVAKKPKAEESVEEIELGNSEMEELDQLAEDTRKDGISWQDLKAELGL